jgi:hypothetical protein
VDALLALETISGDTGVALGLVVTLVVTIGGLVASMLVSRERHGSAILTVTKDNVVRDERADKADARADRIEDRLRQLEEWRIRSEARDDAAAVKSSASTQRGTVPYSTR